MLVRKKTAIEKIPPPPNFPASTTFMSDVYVVVHLAATCDDSAVYVPRDACELLEISWCTVDVKTLQILPRESILVKPTNTPITPACQHKYKLTWDTVKIGCSFKAAIAQFDKKLMLTVAGRDFTFVTVDIHNLRVLLPREARDKSVVLPVYLQHPRVFDLYNEYQKWQSTHPEAMSYPSSCLTNIITALSVDVPETWTEDSADEERLTVDVYANILLQLVKKSMPLENHPLVLTKPYDTAHDAKIFLAERSKILYLSNLPPDTTQSELESWFTQYGGRPIAFWTFKNVDADQKNQQNSANRAKGIAGFAVFSKHEEAAESLYMNGRVLNDKVVEVQASSTRVLDRASELLTPFPPLKNRPRPGDWTCPSCGFSNFQRRIACFRCSFPATSAVAIQEQMYTSGTGQDGSANSSSRRHKNDEKQPSPGYNGYQDHYQNSHHVLKNGNGYNNGYNHGYNHNHNHNGGNGQRVHYGNSVPFRAGDWKCVNETCQYHNFAKNLCCLKCGNAKPSSLSSAHNSSGPSGHSNNVASSAAGSIHSVNTTAAAIAAATASGQPLNLSKSFLKLQQPQPHLSRQDHSSNSSSSSPISNGIYSNMSQLQQYQYQQSKQQGSSHLPQHLALLQGQSQSHSPQQGSRNQRNSQSSSSSPGLYVQNLGYQYKGVHNPSDGGIHGGSGINLLSTQINSLSLNNTGV